MARHLIGVTKGTRIKTTGETLITTKRKRQRKRGISRNRLVLVVNAAPGASVEYGKSE